MIITAKYLFITATRSMIKIIKRATLRLTTLSEIQSVIFNLHINKLEFIFLNLPIICQLVVLKHITYRNYAHSIHTSGENKY